MTKSEFDTVINTLGVPATHTMAKAPNTITAVPKLTIQGVGRAEEAIINAYGVTARQIVIKAASLLTPPEKFDVISIGSERHVIEAVMQKYETGSGDVMGYSCYCKGK